MTKAEYIKNKTFFFSDFSQWDEMFITDELGNNLLTALGRVRSKSLGKALYIHVLNKNVNIENLSGEISAFMRIDGEVCCSEIGDEQFANRRNKVAVILHGRATAQFSCDCWSVIGKNGKRIATRNESITDRSETWVIPNNSKLFGLAFSGSPEFCKKCQSAADRIGCCTLNFKHINKEKEEE